MPSREPRVFTIPAGAPFLPVLSRALLDGVLIEGFPAADEPLSLASATIYVPTRRAAAALAGALLTASGKESLLLPRIAPLGAFESGDTAAFFEPAEDAPPAGPPPAVSELARRHALARLIRAWGKALRGAIRGADDDGELVTDAREPALVASTPAEAYALAADLASLIDDMIIEGAPWERLAALAPEAYDSYWRITLDFLKIATAHWPQWLDEHGLIDRARQVSLLIEAEIAALAAGASRGPTVIAGSTGANRATARLIAAIARSEQGAVVLPGLDLGLDDQAWAMIGASDAAAQGLSGHPQAFLHRLLAAIGMRRDDVRTLGAPPEALRARAAFLSEALRPANSTDRWRERDKALSAPCVSQAFDGVAIIVADNETEEALALAIAMREALETPGKTAALVTPNPSIARRVSAELQRWGVQVEDSAGRTLGESEAGTLARLVLRAAIAFNPLAALALVAHPAVRFGRARAELEEAARALEIGVFRAIPLDTLDDLDRAFTAARTAAADRRAHPAIRAVTEAERRGGEKLARDIVEALSPLRAIGSASSLRDALEAHRAALTSVLDPPAAEPSSPNGLDALSELMDEWVRAAEEGFSCGLSEYSALFDDALASVRAPPLGRGHPRLTILGLLEARLLTFDRVLLAGLDEKVWPPAVETDAFLNRPMRAALGLSAPERRIGQTAHDFVAALGAREAILSRSRKRGTEPTVASRFLQRIVAAAGAGAGAVRAAELKGDAYLGFARAIDRPGSVIPIARPEPRPPAEVRPRALSVTRIETLRRDPYALYCERILNLAPLNPVMRPLGAREAGEAWHSTLQEFSLLYPSDSPPPGAREILRSLARDRFEALLQDRFFAGLTWPNIERSLDFFLDFERESRSRIDRIHVERDGAISFPLFDGRTFTLSARADRIDLLISGGARLIDYKSGAPPGVREVKAGFAPQLTLEAAILKRGGFDGVGALEPERAIYVKLGGMNGGQARDAAGADQSVSALADQHLAELKALLDQFADPQTPYLSRPFPKFVSRFSAYDHLARVKEWSATGGETEAGEAS